MTQNTLVLFNNPAESGPLGSFWQESDGGVLNAVHHVSEALKKLNYAHQCCGVSRLTDIPLLLATKSKGVVFNLVENLEGGSEDVNAVPSVCKAMGWGYTGGSSESLILTQDKALTKYRLSQFGIKVPRGAVVPIDGKIPETLPEGPLFVKPLASDGSEGIDASLAFVESTQKRMQLAKAVERIHATCNQPALIEEYIAGRELNLSLMQRGDEIIPLPPSEVDFSLFGPDRPHVVDYNVKWRPGTLANCISPRRVAQLDDVLRQHLADIVKRSWTACGGGDYGRIDCRMDKNGVVYVLEVNVNCDISPLAGLPAALTAAGIPFVEFINQLLQNAANRK